MPAVEAQSVGRVCRGSIDEVQIMSGKANDGNGNDGGDEGKGNGSDSGC